MGLFDLEAFNAHEGVHLFQDDASGLRAIIAVHATARGPAAGGTRFWSYGSDEDALRDALRLSRAMSYKNAMADIPFGGGKAVVLKPAAAFDREAIFAAFGRAVDRLGGRYVAAADVGVSPQDLGVAARHSRHVAGLEGGATGSGASAPATARGVFGAITVCAQRRLSRDTLQGLRVAVQGVGGVGGDLCRLLSGAGATLVVTDVNAQACAAVADAYGADVVEPDAIYDAPVDVFAPCALGGVLNSDTLSRLQCAIVAGGANNQLATPDAGDALAARNILYAPDYVANGGGIINIAAELIAVREGRAYDPAWVEMKISALIQTLAEVFERSAASGRAPHIVADAMARERLDAAREPVSAPA